MYYTVRITDSLFHLSFQVLGYLTAFSSGG